MEDWVPYHVASVLALVVVAEGELRVQPAHLLIHLGSQEEREKIILEQLLLDHVVKYWSDTPLGEIRVRHSNDRIKVFPKNAVLLLNVPELLVLNQNLRGRLTVLATSNPEVVDIEMPAERT